MYIEYSHISKSIVKANNLNSVDLTIVAIEKFSIDKYTLVLSSFCFYPTYVVPSDDTNG